MSVEGASQAREQGMPFARRLLICTCCLSLPAVVLAADRPASVLHVVNADFIAGQLEASTDPTVVRWRSPWFARPLEFPLSSVARIDYTASGPQPEPVGEYRSELADDDVLYGNLVGVTESEIEVASARVGRVHLAREHIRRICRWKGADCVYLGPNGLVGWKESSTTPQWRDEGGQLVTDQWNASIFGNLGVPDKAVIEVELSWKEKPDFILAFGVDERDSTSKYAFHLEIWNGELVAVGESGRDADLASIHHIEAGETQVRVQLYLDQTQRRLIVVSPGGNAIATLKTTGKKPSIHAGLRLTNKSGDVRINHLRISRWNGAPPHNVSGDRSRLYRTDGSVVYGTLTAYDPKTNQFTIRDGNTDTVVNHDQIADVFFARLGRVGKTPDAPSRSELRVVYRDGSNFTGSLVDVQNGSLTLTCAGIKEPLHLTLAELRSLVPPRNKKPEITALPDGRWGRLEMDGARMRGKIVDGQTTSDAGYLVWQPDFARNSSPLV